MEAIKRVWGVLTGWFLLAVWEPKGKEIMSAFNSLPIRMSYITSSAGKLE